MTTCRVRVCVRVYSTCDAFVTDGRGPQAAAPRLRLTPGLLLSIPPLRLLAAVHQASAAVNANRKATSSSELVFFFHLQADTAANVARVANAV